MKYRTGPITNSSSTSYICEISGETWSGWDSVGRNEVGFVYCENDHTILETFKIEVDEEELLQHKREFCKKRYPQREPNQWELDHDYKPTIYDDDWDEDEVEEWWSEYDGWDITSLECPICQLQHLSQPDAVAYFKKEHGITEAVVFAEVKSKNKRRRRVYDREIVTYGMVKAGLTEDELLDVFREKYGSYARLKEYLYK